MTSSLRRILTLEQRQALADRLATARALKSATTLAVLGENSHTEIPVQDRTVLT